MEAPRKIMVDHINKNTLDNRKENLRLVNGSQNQANRSANSSNTTGLKGVRIAKDGKNFTARLALRKPVRKEIYLGYFKTPEEAAAAYNKEAVINFGKFAQLNDIDNYERTPEVLEAIKKQTGVDEE